MLLVIICLILIGGLISAALNPKQAANQSSTSKPPITTVGEAPSAPPEVAATQAASNSLTGPYAGLTSIQIIEKATAFEKRMADSNRPKPLKEVLKHPLITKEEVRQTYNALGYVARTDPKYEPQATKLIDRLLHDEAEGEKAQKAAIAKAIEDDVDGRKDYAKALEVNLSSLRTRHQS